MPDRILRDEIWESQRFLDLPTDTHRIAYLRFINAADDFGNFEGGSRRMLRMLLGCSQVRSEEHVIQILEQLIGVDLLRRYESDGRELFHIPRSRPHRQYLVRKMPKSPWDADVMLGKRRRIITKKGLAADE